MRGREVRSVVAAAERRRSVVAALEGFAAVYGVELSREQAERIADGLLSALPAVRLQRRPAGLTPKAGATAEDARRLAARLDACWPGGAR